MPEGEPSKAHSCVCVSPVALTGGYRLLGAVNGVQMSLLLDTGAAVTLLREDTWARITAESPQELRPWSTLKLVSAGGTPLTIHGSARVELDLEGEKFTTEIVVVSPLTSEAILGLDFLQGQQASIDLATKTTQSEGRRARFALERPYLHAASSPWEHRSDGSGCGNDRGTTPKRTGDHGESRYLSGGSVASAGSGGQELAGRRGLRSRGADFDYCAGASSESLDGTGDSICRHDASYAGEGGATPRSRGCREQW